MKIYLKFIVKWNNVFLNIVDFLFFVFGWVFICNKQHNMQHNKQWGKQEHKQYQVWWIQPRRRSLCLTSQTCQLISLQIPYQRSLSCWKCRLFQSLLVYNFEQGLFTIFWSLLMLNLGQDLFLLHAHEYEVSYEQPQLCTSWREPWLLT